MPNMLSSVDLSQLELAKLLLNLSFISATVGVWIGVWLEGKRFSERVQEIGWKLLVFCLGIEAIFGIALLQLDAEVSRRSEAENVKWRAAAAEASKIAEGEKLARLKLEKEMAWRSLTEEQRAELREIAKPFAGTAFDLVTYQDDPEALKFADQIGRILIDAGWKFDPIGAFLWFPLVVGVIVEVAPSREVELSSAVNTLTQALARFDVFWNAVAEKALEDDPKRTHVVRIKVGKKPERVAR